MTPEEEKHLRQTLKQVMIAQKKHDRIQETLNNMSQNRDAMENDPAFQQTYRELEDDARKRDKQAIEKYITNPRYGNFKSMEEFNKRVVDRASLDLRKGDPDSPSQITGGAKGYLRNLFDGLTLVGLNSKAEAYFNSWVNGTTTDFEKELIQEEIQDYEDHSPVTSKIAKYGGMALTGARLSQAGMLLPGMAPVAGQPMLNLGREALVEGGIGLGEGTAMALAEDAPVGPAATAGGALGVGMTGVGRLIEPLINPVMRYAQSGWNWIRKKAGKEVVEQLSNSQARALDDIEEAFRNDGMSAEARQAAFQKYINDGSNPEWISLPYLGKTNVHKLVKQAMTEPGQARTLLEEALLNTKKMDRARVQELLHKGLGFSKWGPKQKQDFFITDRRNNAISLYDQAFKEVGDITDPATIARLDEIFKTPGMKKAYNDARKAAKNEHPAPWDMPELPSGKGEPTGVLDAKGIEILSPPKPGKYSLKALDQVKKHLDDKVRISPINPSAPTRKQGKELTAYKNEMLDLLDPNKNPAFSGHAGLQKYTDARKSWTSDSATKEAYEKGQKAFDSGKPSDDVRYEWENLATETERTQYLLGASTSATTKMDASKQPTKSHSKEALTELNKQKYEVLFGGDDATKLIAQLENLQEMHMASGAMIPRSDSGEIMKEFLLNARNIISGGVENIPRRMLTGAASLAGNKILKGTTAAKNEAAGQYLTAPGRQGIGAFEKDATKRGNEITKRLMNRGLLEGAMTTGAMDPALDEMGLLSPQ